MFRRRGYYLLLTLVTFNFGPASAFTTILDHHGIIRRSKNAAWQYRRSRCDPQHHSPSASNMKSIFKLSSSTSSNDGETKKMTNSQETTSKEFRSMALPLLVVQLSSPILSLIDVGAVGRSSGVIALASLGPATSVCDLSMYVFATLSIVTTRRAAAALVAGDTNQAAADTTVGMTVATLLGLLWGLVLVLPATATPLLTLFLPSVVDPLVLPAALAYTRVRALGFIGALLTVVLQSSSLVRRNVKIPLLAVAVASLLNALGDYWLVIRCNMGVTGAAIATVIAQYVTAGILWRSQQQYTQAHCDSSVLQKKKRQLLRNCASFLQSCLSPALALIGKLSVVLTVSATASACGTISLVAHQVVSAVFQMFRPMGDSLGQTMQTLLPGVIGNNHERDSFDSLEGLMDDDDTRKTAAGVSVLSSNAMAVLKVMCRMALTLGLLDALLGTIILGLFPHWFTPDAVVAHRITSTSFLIGCVLFVHSLSMMLEGYLFAVGDAKMVARFYLMNAVFVQLLFTNVRRAGPTLTRVWGAFLLYQLVRASEFGLRLLWNQSRPKVTQKRQLGSLFLRTVRDKVGPTNKEVVKPATNIVWSSSYDAWRNCEQDYLI